ncbi:MAG: hypothetical protein ACYC8T_03450 [Myxococcaceae bacterium]
MNLPGLPRVFATMRHGLLALVLAGGALGAAPPRAPSHEELRKQCLLWAADPKNPWALSHGITGLGATFLASDGRKASEVILGDFLVKGGAGAGGPFSFPRFAEDGGPIEPHLNLHAKTLVLAGVPLTTAFKTSFGKVTLRELVDGVKRGFRHLPDSEQYWHDTGWTLDLLSATHRPGKAAVFKNGAGEEVNLDRVMDDALNYLERTQADLDQALAKGLAQVDKRKQGIYSHNCGGLHLVQAVFSWARFPEVKKRWGARFTRQIEVLFYRLGSESRQYDAALAGAPQYRVLLLTQMMKFYGHFLETTGRLKAETGFTPTEEHKRAIARTKALLDAAVRGLLEAKAFESMPTLKTSNRQLYLDLVGDSCHAAHGWEYWR